MHNTWINCSWTQTFKISTISNICFKRIHITHAKTILKIYPLDVTQEIERLDYTVQHICFYAAEITNHYTCLGSSIREYYPIYGNFSINGLLCIQRKCLGFLWFSKYYIIVILCSSGCFFVFFVCFFKAFH